MNSSSESFDHPTQVGKPGGKKLTAQQKATIFAGLGGATLLAGGSALAWGMSQDGEVNENHPETGTKPTSETKVEEPKPATESTPSKTETTKPTPSSEPMIATHVTDEMSFEDAFKTARQEVGPGGYFEWNGQLYNTYYKEEWNALSVEERQEYAATVRDEQTPETDHATPPSSLTSSPSGQADIQVGEYEGHNVALADIDHDGDAEVIAFDATTGAVDINNDGLMDTRVELDPDTHQIVARAPLATPFEAPKMSDLNTDTTTPVSTEPTPEVEVITVTHEGVELNMADSDHDGYVDVAVYDHKIAVADTDGDHVFDTKMALDSTGKVVATAPLEKPFEAPTVESVSPEEDPAVATDYDNNADVSEWVA